jgi:hypothetical protein
MNERIKELAAQAGFDVAALTRPYPGGFPREDILALESFAELIIDEVYSFLLDPSEDDEPWHSRAAVKKHFGVE